jgi:hypothetical protein
MGKREEIAKQANAAVVAFIFRCEGDRVWPRDLRNA